MRDGRNKYRPPDNDRAILSRRSLLELAGLAAVTAAFPPVSVMAKPSASSGATAPGVGPVMEKVSAYMSEARGRALPTT